MGERRLVVGLAGMQTRSRAFRPKPRMVSTKEHCLAPLDTQIARARARYCLCLYAQLLGVILWGRRQAASEPASQPAS